jgi:hypothetical protein
MPKRKSDVLPDDIPNDAKVMISFMIPKRMKEEAEKLRGETGMSLSTLFRKAWAGLRLAGGEPLEEKIARIDSGVTHEQLSERLAKQEVALREAAKAMGGLCRLLGGDVSDDSAAALARLDKMAAWAKGVEEKLQAGGASADVAMIIEHVDALANRVDGMTEWVTKTEARLVALEERT